MMKSILVYGDSNTWGQTSKSRRYDYEKRWTSIVEEKLGGEFKVYSAGVSGRIAGSHHNVPKVKCGKDAFEVVYRQAFPVDLVIIALGTNDIKNKYDLSADTIVEDLEWYSLQLADLQGYDVSRLEPKLLYLLPPNFDTDKFDGDESKRQQIIEQMNAKSYSTVVADNTDMSEDGVHFSESGHFQFAQIVSKKIKELV